MASKTKAKAAPRNDGGADLLAAIFASPDDDAPRLVYADWLLERGDARGEFIQIQIKLGRTVYGASAKSYEEDEEEDEDGKPKLDPAVRKDLEKRQKSLLKKHQAEWLKPIRPHVRTWEWKRGFVDRVEADGVAFLRGAEAVLSQTPLFHAELTGLKPAHFPLFAKEPAFRSLRSLSLAQQRIGPTTASSVFLSPHWCGLRAFDLWGNPLTAVGVGILASAQHFDALETLNMSSTDMGLAGLEALAKAEFFPRLKELDLDVGYDGDGNKGYGPEAAKLLMRGESLVSLGIEGGQLGDAGIKAIAASPALANLETLKLFDNKITNDGAIALASSKHLKKLRTVAGLVGYGRGLKDKSKGAIALRERFGAGAQ